MRLRNIPRAEGTIQAHPIVIKRPEDQRGCWRQVFGNNRGDAGARSLEIKGPSASRSGWGKDASS